MTMSRLKRTTIKAGLRLLLLLLILCTGCMLSRDVSRGPKCSPSPRAPITQVYFYPKAGQSTEQQSRDHYECYNWAMQQTGFDPSQSSIPPSVA